MRVAREHDCLRGVDLRAICGGYLLTPPWILGAENVSASSSMWFARCALGWFTVDMGFMRRAIAWIRSAMGNMQRFVARISSTGQWIRSMDGMSLAWRTVNPIRGRFHLAWRTVNPIRGRF